METAAVATKLCKELGVEIDPELLVLSLTHRSFAYEAGGIPTNERLEFLGDSVVGVIVTEELYRRHENSPEGQLARMRAAVVSQVGLAKVARKLELGTYVLLGKGESRDGGADKDSILSDAFEAIIGAAYLCNDFETVRRALLDLMKDELDNAVHLGAALDWKSSLQELVAAQGRSPVSYRIESEGPDHARFFTATAVIDETEFGTGTGESKKLAEHRAAEMAYQALLGDGE